MRRRRRGSSRPRGPGKQVGDLPELVTLLAAHRNLPDLVARLHASLAPRLGTQASLVWAAAAGLERLEPRWAVGLAAWQADPWRPTAGERRLLRGLFARGQARYVAPLETRLPGLARHLPWRGAVLVPVADERPRALVALGVRTAPRAAQLRLARAAGDTLGIALERAALEHDAARHRHVRALLLALWRTAPSTTTLASGFEALCQDVSRTFDAERTTLWLHDRRAHQLVLAAASDPAALAGAPRVATSDPTSLAAQALRRPSADLVGTPGGRTTIAVPLRGRRRALGTLLIEGVAADGMDETRLLEHADELGYLLSSTLENLQLFDEVLRSRRELENTFNSIADLIAVSDRRLTLVHANQAFASRVGRSPQELLERPLAEFLGPDTVAWISALDLPAGATLPEPTTRVIEDPVLQGTFSITLSTLLSHDGVPIGLVLVARDVTEQMRLERDRAVLRDRLAQSEKLAALGQFVAGIAHELNNPLQGVLGHIELLRTTGAVPLPLRRDFRTVYREAERAAKIVQNLLVFAGSRRLARRPLRLNAVVSRALALRLGAWREAGIDLVRRYDERLPRLLGDPLLLQQAFLNILINAEQAVLSVTGPHRIEVTTAHRPEEGVAVVEIRDTGPGIAAEVLPRIFEPFFTTKEVGRGTGLGLAITYGIVQEHGGTVTAGNHPEGGAVIRVQLPTDKMVIK